MEEEESEEEKEGSIIWKIVSYEPVAFENMLGFIIFQFK